VKNILFTLFVFMFSLIYANDNNDVFGVWNTGERNLSDSYPSKTTNGVFQRNINSMIIDVDDDNSVAIWHSEIKYRVISITQKQNFVELILEYDGTTLDKKGNFIDHCFKGKVSAKFLDQDTVFFEVDKKNSESDFNPSFTIKKPIFWRATKITTDILSQ